MSPKEHHCLVAEQPGLEESRSNKMSLIVHHCLALRLRNSQAYWQNDPAWETSRSIGELILGLNLYAKLDEGDVRLAKGKPGNLQEK
eukprot:1141598-Pelagomonas_calceolata.AAC.8